jgi:hypothetical protein
MAADHQSEAVDQRRLFGTPSLAVPVDRVQLADGVVVAAFRTATAPAADGHGCVPRSTFHVSPKNQARLFRSTVLSFYASREGRRRAWDALLEVRARRFIRPSRAGARWPRPRVFGCLRILTVSINRNT